MSRKQRTDGAHAWAVCMALVGMVGGIIGAVVASLPLVLMATMMLAVAYVIVMVLAVSDMWGDGG